MKKAFRLSLIPLALMSFAFACTPKTSTPQPQETSQSAHSPYAKPGFHTEMEDGRLWVFRSDAKELEEFRQHGELAKHVIRPGAGPGGITLKAPDAETLNAYLAH